MSCLSLKRFLILKGNKNSFHKFHFFPDSSEKCSEKEIYCMFECAKQPLNKYTFVFLFHPQNLLAGQGVLNDNNWHTVRFSRRASNLRLQVDNSTPVRGTLCMYQQHIFFALIRVVTCRWIFEISCSWYADNVEARSQIAAPRPKKYNDILRDSGKGPKLSMNMKKNFIRKYASEWFIETCNRLYQLIP